MRDQKGITLIALIITIIVMLILVVVTLTVAFQTGLFDRAGEAAQNWSDEQQKESDVDNQISAGGTTGLNNILNQYGVQ